MRAKKKENHAWVAVKTVKDCKIHSGKFHALSLARDGWNVDVGLRFKFSHPI